MKKFIIILALFLLAAPGVLACTNFPINVGVIDTPEGRVLAETLSILINERSGVTVGTHYFKTSAEMYKAVAEEKLEMIIENTTAALLVMDTPVVEDPQVNLDQAKELFKGKKLIWLKPFAFTAKDTKGNSVITASVISRKSLTQFPALPRVIGKLAKVIDNEALAGLVKGVKGSKKPRVVARDFLIEKHLI